MSVINRAKEFIEYVQTDYNAEQKEKNDLMFKVLQRFNQIWMIDHFNKIDAGRKVDKVTAQKLTKLKLAAQKIEFMASSKDVRNL